MQARAVHAAVEALLIREGQARRRPGWPGAEVRSGSSRLVRSDLARVTGQVLIAPGRNWARRRPFDSWRLSQTYGRPRTSLLQLLLRAARRHSAIWPGVGGQPGMRMSIGNTSSSRPTSWVLSPTMLRPRAQSPSAATRRGSGIARYAVCSGPAMRVVTGPVMSRMSACRGEATMSRPWRWRSWKGLLAAPSSCSQPLQEPAST